MHVLTVCFHFQDLTPSVSVVEDVQEAIVESSDNVVVEAPVDAPNAETEVAAPEEPAVIVAEDAAPEDVEAVVELSVEVPAPIVTAEEQPTEAAAETVQEAPVEATPAVEVPEVQEPAEESVSEEAKVEDEPAEASTPEISVTPDTTAASEDDPVPSTPAVAEADRPKSPWTPSYSVVVQGPGIVADDAAELKELEQLPPAEEVQSEEPVIVVEAEEPAVQSEEAPAVEVEVCRFLLSCSCKI